MKSKIFLLLPFIIGGIHTYAQIYLGGSMSEIKYDLSKNFAAPSYQIKFSETIIKIDTLYRFDLPREELYMKIESFGPNYKDSLEKLPRVIDTIDTLSILNVHITGKEKIEMQIFFDSESYHPTGSLDRACDSVVINHYCTACLDKHVESILSSTNEFRQWKKLSSYQYISKNLTSEVKQSSIIGGMETEKVGSAYMNIIPRNDKNDHSTICLYMNMMDRSDWHKLTK
jgi:hypothetical protein